MLILNILFVLPSYRAVAMKITRYDFVTSNLFCSSSNIPKDAEFQPRPESR